MAAQIPSRGSIAQRPRPRASLSSRSPSGEARARGSAVSRMPSPTTSATTTSATSSMSSSSSSSAPSISGRIKKFKPATPASSADLPQRMYSRALALCREQDYNRAFAVFERVVSLDAACSKAWVSWAQAEKRSDPKAAVAVLQAGLSLNRRAPPSVRAPLAQAWGLAELQRGNNRAAVALLARAVEADPGRCSPVLRWAPVIEAAREAARERSERRGTRGGGGGNVGSASSASSSSSSTSSSAAA